MMRKRSVLLLAMVSVPVAAQSPRFDLEALRKIVRIQEVELSPDGSRIAVVVGRPNFADNRYESELLLIDPATGASRSLTHDRWAVSGIKWSPAGDRLAFLSTSDTSATATPQVFVLPVSGGEAMRVTAAPKGVEQFAWNPAGGVIAYASADTAPTRTGEEKGNDAFEVGDDSYLRRAAASPVHLWVVADSGGAPRQVTSGAWSLASADEASPMSYSPDGTSIAVVGRDDAHSGGFPVSIRVVDVATGTFRVIGRGAAIQPVFSPDGRSLLISRARGSQHEWSSHSLIAIDLASGAERDVTKGVDRSFWGGMWVPGSNTVLAMADDGTTEGAWLFNLDGSARKLPLGDAEPTAITVAANGRIAFAALGQQPQEIYYLGAADSVPRRLTNLNAAMDRYALARSEGFEWDVPKGMRADGVVTYPPGYEAGKHYPLLLWIHGGPMEASTTGFNAMIQYFAAQGWLVFQPNYRGSTNRGNAYQSAIIGDAGDGPGQDVMAGVAALTRRGIVDTARVAVSGWSYGGYMTTWLMGHSRIWKAAVAGAAVTDFVDSYNLSDINVGFGNGWGGSIYTDRFESLARAQSPITYWRNMKAPTLILSDVGDERVPITESFKLYHALKDNGVPVKFIAYPIGGHFPGDPVRSRDIMRRAVEWLTPYLR